MYYITYNREGNILGKGRISIILGFGLAGCVGKGKVVLGIL